MQRDRTLLQLLKSVQSMKNVRTKNQINPIGTKISKHSVQTTPALYHTGKNFLDTLRGYLFPLLLMEPVRVNDTFLLPA